MKKVFLFLMCLSWGLVSAQDKDVLDIDKFTLFEGDTLVDLDEVLLLKPIQFKNLNDKRYYYWFRTKVLRAYPYAKIASEKLEDLNAQLETLDSKRKKKKYIVEMQKYMENEFTDQLKKLTRTEGRILIKLIYRQSGVTVYDLVKDYRSGWKAFSYNTTARVFKLSLKYEYNPKGDPEDYMIEDILQRAWRDNLIVLKPAKNNFDYFKNQNLWEFEYPKHLLK